MIVTSQDNLSDYQILETIGIVKGNSVRARHIGNDILAGLKNIIGGEISEYTKLLSQAREQAYNRMIEDAELKGANAVVCFRYTTSSVMQGAAELLAFGTAVKVKKK